MDVLELASGQDVVLDVGHSGAITGIARYQDLIISGGRDGFLYVRRSDGRSVIPPVHLQEITCVAMPADIDVAVVGANDKVFGVDLETGTKSPLAGFDGVSPIAAASIGDVVLVGCSDGSLRTVSVENGTVTVSAGGGAAVLAVASHGRFAAVSYADGAVRLLDHDCTEVWSAKLRRSEAEQLAVAADGTVVAAGTGRPSDDGTFPGTLVRLGAAGAVEARTVLPSGMVSAATLDGDAVIVAISDGSVHRLGIALDFVRREHASRAVS